MRQRDLFLILDEAPGIPLGQRVVSTLQGAIRDGRLPPGAALPGSRILAQMLGVHRQTIVSAMHELEAQGWLVARPYRGTFVEAELPSGPREEGRPVGMQAEVGFDLPSVLQPISLSPSGALLLADGAADPRLAPAQGLSRGYQRALARHGARLLGERDPAGNPFLREALAGWLSERNGILIEPERILMTGGSRGALAILVNTLFRNGDVAAVENPGNRGAWEVFQAGVRLELRPVAVDAEGLAPQPLEDLLKRERVRMLYVTPRRQFPTGASMSGARGAEILQLAAKHRVAILEDDYDGEFAYLDRRPQTLLAQDTTGQVIHIGSLSRLLAPGVRLGFMVLPKPLMPLLARVKRSMDEAADPAFEWAVADLVRDGELSNHIRKVRKVYASRRDLMAGLLTERFGSAMAVEVPSGGMGLWLRLLGPVDAGALVLQARQFGLVLNPPSHFHLGPPEPAFRIGFAQANETEIREAVDRLHRAYCARS